MNLIIVDDHQMFLDGLVSVLNAETDYNVVFTAADGQAAVDYLGANPEASIDLVITDVNMPGVNGVQLNDHLKQRSGDTKTLAVSMRQDGATIHALAEGGVDGYVPKDAEKEELLRAIRTVLRGERYFSEAVKRTYSESIFGSKGPAPEARLTKRERDVLRLIAGERTTQEIADELFLSKHTVEGYRKNLIAKLGVRNVAGLVKEAIRRGLA